MSFQKLEKFAKFLRFYYVSGDFDDGQIIYDDKYYSQINSSSENSKIKDLAHELAHFILSNNSNYRKLNFGLDLPKQIMVIRFGTLIVSILLPNANEFGGKIKYESL